MPRNSITTDTVQQGAPNDRSCNFATIYRDARRVLSEHGISGKAILVYLELLEVSDRNNRAYRPAHQIANSICAHVKSISRYIAKLCNAGLLIRTRQLAHGKYPIYIIYHGRKHSNYKTRRQQFAQYAKNQASADNRHADEANRAADIASARSACPHDVNRSVDHKKNNNQTNVNTSSNGFDNNDKRRKKEKPLGHASRPERGRFAVMPKLRAPSLRRSQKAVQTAANILNELTAQRSERSARHQIAPEAWRDALSLSKPYSPSKTPDARRTAAIAFHLFGHDAVKQLSAVIQHNKPRNPVAYFISMCMGDKESWRDWWLANSNQKIDVDTI